MLKFHNVESITKAQKQSEQLEYFVSSEIQHTRLDDKYIQTWAQSKYQTNDYFLNWVKSIFKTENFLTFYKYLRFPLATTKLIKNEIEPQLKRVFDAEDSYFKYDIRGKETADFINDLKVKEFNQDIFKALIYAYNSVIVTDADSEEPNKAYRYLVDIKKVRSIELKGKEIKSIVFKGVGCDEEGEEHEGLVYIDSERYALYKDDKETLISEQPHDLGYCPVHFITDMDFNKDPIVKESIFSFIREELEEYVFLKTLQRMTEPNGAIPVVSKLETESDDQVDMQGDGLEPSSDEAMSSQRAGVFVQNPTQGQGDLQTGTIHNIPISAIEDQDGNINMDVVRSYLNFYYIPVEVLTYLNERVKEIERSIISSIIGDVVESSEESKNELQIKKSISALENRLISFADKLNRVRYLSDKDILSLQFGVDAVENISIHYGTDFFLETQEQLFNEFEKAPNSLERKNIIVRINQNRYKNNVDTQTRSMLLYDIIPYVSDKDFDIAKDKVSRPVFELQTRFNYWIAQFEAEYGDLVQFYKAIENRTKAEKLREINDLLFLLINTYLQDENNLAKDSQNSGVQPEG